MSCADSRSDRLPTLSEGKAIVESSATRVGERMPLVAKAMPSSVAA